MDKILITLVALGIAGVGIVEVGATCTDEEGKTYFPAEEVILREQVQEKIFMSEIIYGEVVYRDVIVETGKICFQNSEDYETAKNGYFNTYVNKTPEERVDHLLIPESLILGDMVTHEIEKVGVVTFDFKEGDDMILKHIEAVNKL